MSINDRLVCKHWIRAARKGEVRETSGTARLAVIDGSNRFRLPASCPWCGAKFYMKDGGRLQLTLAGRAHRNMIRRFGSHKSSK